MSLSLLKKFKKSSTKTKIFICAAAFLLIGGIITTIILLSGNKLDTFADEYDDTNTSSSNQYGEWTIYDFDDDTSDTDDTESTDPNDTSDTSNQPPDNSPAVKYQYRYRDKEYCSENCDLGTVKETSDGLIAGNGWVYIKTTYAFTEWSEWSTTPRVETAGPNDQIEGNTDGSGQGWRIRQKVPTHFWWRWSKWSEWQDAKVLPSDNREVDTRQI